MTDLEIVIVDFITECQLRNCYRYGEYQMLHGVKYRKEMAEENKDKIRNCYINNCIKAAYELKTYYMENRMLSNTIVLKRRSEEGRPLPCIEIYSELDGTNHTYTHHAVEIFKEHGKYKVFDILHSDKTVWLENYLDEVCRTNHCQRSQLRYDFGYLAPCHAFAGNMEELRDLMYYLDRVYCIGKPQMNRMNIHGTSDESLFLSDDVFLDFDELPWWEFGSRADDIMQIYRNVHVRLVKIQFEFLTALCMGHILYDQYIMAKASEHLFHSADLCRLMADMEQSMPDEYENIGQV